jgi:hypothetical protein
MRKLVLSCLVLVSAAFATAAVAKHAHHRALPAQERAPAPAAESLTTIGTPDCHTQGRLLRIANHCPPAAIAAAPPVTHENSPRKDYFSRW